MEKFTFFLAQNETNQQPNSTTPNDEIRPGTSLLKVDHYTDRVTSLATMLAHELPYKAFEPEISSKSELAHPALSATSNDHEALDQVSAPKGVKSLFDTDLNVVEDCNSSFDHVQDPGVKHDIHESVDKVEEEKKIETPEIPDLQENFDNDANDFDFSANFDASEPNEMVADDEATEEINESQTLVQRAVRHDHWYLEPFESDLEPPNAKRPRLDQG